MAITASRAASSGIWAQATMIETIMPEASRPALWPDHGSVHSWS
jgi:hypothetical protein